MNIETKYVFLVIENYFNKNNNIDFINLYKNILI